MALRSSRCAGLYARESRAHPLRHDDVALAFIAFERLLERGRNFLRLACEREDVGEVRICVGLDVQQVGRPGEADRLLSEVFALRVATTACQYLCSHLACQRLRERVVAAAKLGGAR